MSGGLRALVREPLVHFLLFGALVVGFEVAWSDAAPVGDEAVIELTAAQTTSITAAWTSTHGEPPTSEELDRELRRWLDEEILVREARRLGLDRDDPVVRAHLAEKMAWLTTTLAGPTEPSEAELRALYEQTLDRYRLESRVTLRQLYVDGLDGEAERRAAELLDRWRAGGDPRELIAVADPPPGGPVLRGRTPERLTDLHGAAFAESVFALQEGDLTALPSTSGWHVVQVEALQIGRQLDFEEARDRVAVRWRSEHLQGATDRAMDELRRRYTVRGWP